MSPNIKIEARKANGVPGQFLRACIRQTEASHPKFAFTPTFIFFSPICSNNCGVVFLEKIYFQFREMTFFVRPLKYANFHRE